MWYYFDTTDHNGAHRDHVGVECTSHDGARKLAERALGELVCDALPDGGEQRLTISVRDEPGEVIFQASLLFRSEWLVDRRE